MPTKRIPLRREYRGKLTLFEEQELWLGVCNYPAFADDDERCATWERHRTRIMDTFAHAGHRPAAWWAYDAPEGLPFDYHRERSILYEADLLEADERGADHVLARRVRAGEHARLRLLHRRIRPQGASGLVDRPRGADGASPVG
jgi:hypothetical protein